jgi:hypothetical protein
VVQKLKPDRTLPRDNRLIIKWMDKFCFASGDLTIFPRLMKTLVKGVTY